MSRLFIGFIVGMIILLPGMSGGTVLLLFGLYESLIHDFSKWRFRPYITLAIGIVLGIFVGGRLFAFLLTAYRDMTLAFLLSCLLASIKGVIKGYKVDESRFAVLLIMGISIGFLSIQTPFQVMAGDSHLFKLFIAGGVSSATMIIPGLPGSSVLIMMNVYEEIIYAVAVLDWLKLLVFGIGSLIGMIGLVKLLSFVYEKYRKELSFLFSGIILGSSVVLLPSTFHLGILAISTLGFVSTWKLIDL